MIVNSRNRLGMSAVPIAKLASTCGKPWLAHFGIKTKAKVPNN
jgi:hypothetical protein